MYMYLIFFKVSLGLGRSISAKQLSSDDSNTNGQMIKQWNVLFAAGRIAQKSKHLYKPHLFRNIPFKSVCLTKYRPHSLNDFSSIVIYHGLIQIDFDFSVVFFSLDRSDIGMISFTFQTSLITMFIWFPWR